MQSFSILARCPQCGKLYSIDREEVRTEKPQFECVSCQTRFWFSFPPPSDAKEVKTYRAGEGAAESQDAGPEKIKPIPSLSPINTSIQLDTFACSKCGYQNLKGSSECSSCGMVFEKARKQALGIKQDVSGTPELKTLWERVISDYDNQAVHEAFINMALNQKNLPFASQQYRLILEANPNESMALRMRDKIINIATLTYVPPRRELPQKKKLSIPMIVIGIGLLMIITGFLIPQLRSVIPLGGFIAVLGGGSLIIGRRRI